MRHALLTFSALTGLALMLVFVPRFTAQKTEAHRREAVRRLAGQAAVTRPACPVGDALDAFLSRATTTGAPWQAACRELPPPPGKVFVVESTRTGYAQCRDFLAGQSRAGCTLDEPLDFLADAGQSRSVARLKLPDAAGQPVVWITPQPLAWGEYLVDEHRRYLLLALFSTGLCWLLAMAGRHGRDVYVLQRRQTRAQGPAVPVWAEFWLLFFLHPYARSLPVDLQDDYERWLEEGRARADALYWEQVRRSLPMLIGMRLQGWVPALGRLIR